MTSTMSSLSDLTLTKNFSRKTARTDARETSNRLKIVLGGDKYEIIVPKALICSKSQYFENACYDQENPMTRTLSVSKKHLGMPGDANGYPSYRFKKYRDEKTDGRDAGDSAVANIIRLKHIDAKIFSIFLAWAVTGSLEEAAHLITDTAESKERAFGKTLQLLECYILAENLRAEDFKNHVIDHIVSNEKSLLYEHKAGSLVGHTVEHVYSNTVTGSPLRRFMVDVTINTVPKDLASLLPDKNPNVEYIRDCFRAYQNALATTLEKLQTPWEKHPCEYHDHSDRPQGYRCRK